MRAAKEYALMAFFNYVITVSTDCHSTDRIDAA
jgi:hypothetical protein